jgi:hydroxymethylbilane synthase
LAPAGAHAIAAGERLTLEAMVGHPEGRSLLRDRIEGAVADGAGLGATLATRLLSAGGDAILREVRGTEAAGGS